MVEGFLRGGGGGVEEVCLILESWDLNNGIMV